MIYFFRVLTLMPARQSGPEPRQPFGEKKHGFGSTTRRAGARLVARPGRAANSTLDTCPLLHADGRLGK